MSQCRGVREVGYLDCAGGGQNTVEGNYAYIGHITGPQGTSIVNVSDPEHPRVVAALSVEAGMDSHKVRAANGIMLVNREVDTKAKAPGADRLQGGLGIYDVSDPSHPREILL